jgi:hypothetical protein
VRCLLAWVYGREPARAGSLELVTIDVRPRSERIEHNLADAMQARAGWREPRIRHAAWDDQVRFLRQFEDSERWIQYPGASFRASRATAVTICAAGRLTRACSRQAPGGRPPLGRAAPTKEVEQ